MYKAFHNGLAAVAKCFGIDISPITKAWTRIYEHRVKTRGKQNAVKFCKELNTVAERYALHQRIEPIPWTKSDKDGYPKILNFAKQNLRSKDQATVVLTLSVFRSVESLRLPISRDISTVTQPCSYDNSLIESILTFIPEWVKRIPTLHLHGLKYHFTLKNGPNGHALKTSDMDISAVMGDEPIYEAIRTCERILKGSPPMKIISRNQSGSEIHSRLTQFPEKAGKTRTIAVIDYYSQRCLRPLHEGLMDILGKLVSDGTFSHQSVGKFAKQMTKEKSFIACSDLTAATDRFPAIIQHKLLAELLKDDELSNALWTLLSKRTFHVSWSDELVTYQCGQPMGAHASWPLFALAHHLIVEYCAMIVDKAIKHQYKIIGDDNAIAREDVYEVYLSVMTRLGLTINPGKTTLSTKGAEFSAAEVAKQLYLNGINISPLTPGFIRDIKKQYMFNTCLGVLMERYEFIRPEAPSMLISALFPKEKARKLVWVLASNPVNGNIKPSDEGYDISSPWDPEKSGEYIENHREMVISKLIDQADKMIDESLNMMGVNLEDIDPLELLSSGSFDPKSFSLGSPWKDSTSPEPACYAEVRFSIEQRLTEVQNELAKVSRSKPIEDILALIDFVPDPRLPYQDRKELRAKRMASSILSLLDYNEKVEFVQLDW